MQAKKLSVVVLIILGLMLLLLTGCGGNTDNYDKNGEYAQYIEAIRNGELSFLYNGRTIGELLDNALKDSKWDFYPNYVPNGNEVPISITGEDKNTGDQIEIIYTVKEDTLNYTFQRITINGEEGTWTDMINLCSDSADELDNTSNE